MRFYIKIPIFVLVVATIYFIGNMETETYIIFDDYNMDNSAFLEEWYTYVNNESKSVRLNATEGINGSNAIQMKNVRGLPILKYIDIDNLVSVEGWVRTNSSGLMNLDIYQSGKSQSLATIVVNGNNVIRYTNFNCDNHSVINQPILQKYTQDKWLGMRIVYHQVFQRYDVWLNNGSVEGWKEIVNGVCLGEPNANGDRIWFEGASVYIDDFKLVRRYLFPST